MAKHANGKNNYKLSGGAIAVIVALALFIAVAIWWVAGRGSQNQESQAQECVAGELTLPIAAADTEAGHSLIDAYGKTHPVVRDYCVRAELVDDVTDAAVYLAPDTGVSRQILDSAGRSIAVSDPKPVSSQAVGVAGRGEVKLEDLTIDKVLFPVRDNPTASALVASQVAGNANAAVQALTAQRIDSAANFDAANGKVLATTETTVPEGSTFTPVGAKAVYVAFPLNQSDRVDENQARAGQDFARVAAEQFDGSEKDQPVISDLVWAAALPAGGEAITGDTAQKGSDSDGADPANHAGSLAAADTLFLLDTSDAMAPYLQAAKDAIADAAVELGAQGKQVGLWNYSSPLNPGVQVGYRQNITVSPDADSVAVAVRRFLTGGVPQTRQAVEAAADVYGGLETTTRVVVVTTGTADAGNDQAFLDAVRGAAGDKVEITVVRVGGGEVDQALESVAAHTADAEEPGDIAGALNTVVGL